MNQGQGQQGSIDMFLSSFQCKIPVLLHTPDLMVAGYQSFQIEKLVLEFFTGTYLWDEKDQDADKEEANPLHVEDEEVGEDAGKKKIEPLASLKSLTC